MTHARASVKLPPVKSPTRAPRNLTPPQPHLGALREVPYMGVIFVVAEAMKLGFVNGHPDWSNLGQGQPEVGQAFSAGAK